MIDRDEKLLRDLQDPKWSRFRDTAAQAARRIEDLKNDCRYWQDLWQKAATRLLQVDPDINSKSTTVVERFERLRQLEGNTEPRVIAEIKARKPDPWRDV